MNGISSERLTGQMLEEHREILSGKDIQFILHDLMLSEKPPEFNVPQILQVILMSLESNLQISGSESIKYYHMIQEVIMKLTSNIAKYHQKLAGDVAQQIPFSDQLAWVQMYMGPYVLIHQALLEQYNAVTIKLKSLR